MKISELIIQNFRSYGNNKQTINFEKDGGELILLKGRNGSGKTSIQQAIDFVIYGKITGKRKKTIPIAKIPNRLNGNLFTALTYEVGNKKINITRTLNPSKLKLLINGQDYDKAGKANVNAKIEETVGMDFDTFKSFISVSVNDFKNFMSLAPDDKRKLLDKLFNLGILSELNKILNDLKNQNEQELQKIEMTIANAEENIADLEKLLNTIETQKNRNVENQIQEIREKMTGHVELFKTIKIKNEKIEQKKSELEHTIRQKQEQNYKIKFQIEKLQKDFDLYEQEKCPTCGSDLDGDFHQERKNELLEQIDKLKQIQESNKKQTTEIEEKLTKLKTFAKDTTEKFHKLSQYLQLQKQQLQKLNQESKSSKDSAEIQEVIERIQKYQSILEGHSQKIYDKKLNREIFDHLKFLFSEKGIKQLIISEIVKPINQFIQENTKLLDLPFRVELDEQFDAQIKLLNDDIDPETLSTGEEKKVNISIMLAYLKMIRMKHSVNLLFLDEIFASIDIEGIYSIVRILKQFAVDWKLNIILMHHSELDANLFDRIIVVRKQITSQIEEDRRINNLAEIF